VGGTGNFFATNREFIRRIREFQFPDRIRGNDPLEDRFRAINRISSCDARWTSLRRNLRNVPHTAWYAQGLEHGKSGPIEKVNPIGVIAGLTGQSSIPKLVVTDRGKS
jgi:hypothetical protein